MFKDDWLTSWRDERQKAVHKLHMPVTEIAASFVAAILLLTFLFSVPDLRSDNATTMRLNKNHIVFSRKQPSRSGRNYIVLNRKQSPLPQIFIAEIRRLGASIGQFF